MSVTLTATSPATVRTLSAVMPTSTGTVAYTIPGAGVSEDMRAVIVEGCLATALDTDTDGASACRGMCDGTTEAVASWSSEHGVATSDAYTYTAQDAVVALMDPADGSLLAEAVFDSWTDGGVVLDWTTAPASAYRMSVTLVAGDDVLADLQVVDPNDSIAGTVTVTPSYSDSTELVVAMGGLNTSAFSGTLENAASMTHGACSNDGITVNQTCGLWYDGDGSASGNPNAYISSSRILQFGGAGLLQSSLGCSGFNASTGAFTLTTNSIVFPSAGRVALLCLHLPIEANAYTLAFPTATGTTGFTDPGFTPQAIHTCGSALNALNVMRTNGLAGTMSSGWADLESREWAMSWSDEDNAGTLNTQSRASESALDNPLDTGGTTGFLATLDSMDASGFTLDFSSVVSASTRYGYGFAVEEEDGDDIIAVDDEGVVATDGVVTLLVDPELEIANEGVVASDGVVTALVDPELAIVDEGVVATDGAVTVLVDAALVVVAESVDASDGTVTLLDGESSQLVQAVGESVTASDVIRLLVRTPVVRGLRRAAAALGGNAPAGTVGANNPQATIAPPGLDVDIQTLIVDESFLAADDSSTTIIDVEVLVVGDAAVFSDGAVALPVEFITPIVVDDSIDASDGVVTSLLVGSTLVEVVDEGVDASDGVVTELDTYTPPSEWDPPTDLFFPAAYYVEPPLGRNSISNRQFNDIDARDDVVELYDFDPPNEEWRGIGNDLRWDIRADRHSRAHYKGRDDSTPSYPDHQPFCVKLNSGSSVVSPSQGEFEYIHFWDIGFYNEGQNDTIHPVTGAIGDAARFLAGVDQSNPNPSLLSPTEDWRNSIYSPLNVGVHCFHRCVFRIPCGPTEVNCNPICDPQGGFGVKMHLHQQAPHDLLIDACRFDDSWEHGIYSEWIQRIHVKDSTFGPTGGNAIQIVSRGGHTVTGESDMYGQGNPLHLPSGLNGWAHIESSHIETYQYPYRDASEVSFSGFLGPIYIHDMQIINCVSGILLGSDAFKGAWMANGTSVPWDNPVIWRKDVEGSDGSAPYAGMYVHNEAWIDNVYIEHEAGATGQRGGLQLGSSYAIHVNRFQCVGFTGGNKAVRIDNDMQTSANIPQNPIGVPMRKDPLTGLAAVYFYDVDSVLDHVTSIWHWDPLATAQSGAFVAYTYEELDQMTVGGLP